MRLVNAPSALVPGVRALSQSNAGCETPSLNPNGSKPSLAVVGSVAIARRPPPSAARRGSAASSAMRSGAENSMRRTCGSRSPTPHSQYCGALAPMSPSRCERLGLPVMPSTNSGEKRAIVSVSTPSASNPAAVVVVVDRGLLKTVAEARVARQGERGEAGRGLVPDVGRYLVAALEALELHLAPCPFLDEPVGLRIGDRARERQIESERGLVDEVVHIGFVEAVVIAAEEGAPLAVDERPVREMDRADAAERAAGEDVARRPVDAREDDEFEPEPEPAGLDRAHGRVRVGDVVVLAEPKFGDPVRIVAVLDDGVGKLAPAQFDRNRDERDDEERDHDQRKQDEQSGGDDEG